MPSRGACVPSSGAAVPSRGACVPSWGARLPSWRTRVPAWGADVPSWRADRGKWEAHDGKRGARRGRSEACKGRSGAAAPAPHIRLACSSPEISRTVMGLMMRVTRIRKAVSVHCLASFTTGQKFAWRLHMEKCTQCSRNIPTAEPACVHEAQIVCRDCNDAARPTCPSCRGLLKKEPKRAAGCPHCGETVYVRSRQVRFATKLLTSDQAEEADWAANLSGFGITHGDFDRQWRMFRQSGGTWTSDDVIWALLNESIGRAREANEFRALHLLQADFLVKRGRDPGESLRQAFVWRVRDWQASEVVSGLRILADRCCEACAENHNRQLNLEEALRAPPLPNPKCTRRYADGQEFAWCTCTCVSSID